MHRKQFIFILLVKLIAVSQSVCCGPNEVPGPICGSSCPPTCAVPMPDACTAVCILNACECEPGYIRSEGRNSPCIPESKCPKPIEKEPRIFA